MSRSDSLPTIMSAHSLSRDDVARLLGVSERTVYSWLRPAGGKAARNMPGPMLELLRLKLETRK